jgi:hypothetical protein
MSFQVGRAGLVATLPLEADLYDSDAYVDVWALKLMVEKFIPTHDGLDGLDGLVAATDCKIARCKGHLRVLTSFAP